MGKDRQKQKMLSIGEAALYLNISRDTLRRWEKKGKVLPLRSPTNRRYYTKNQLDKLINRPQAQVQRQSASPKKSKESKKKGISFISLVIFGVLGFLVAIITASIILNFAL